MNEAPLMIDAETLQKMNQEAQNQMAKQAAAIRASIVSMSPEEFYELLESYLNCTEVVMEGLNLCDNLSEGTAIAYAALEKLRSGVDYTLSWVNAKFDLNMDGVIELDATNTKPSESEEL